MSASESASLDNAAIAGRLARTADVLELLEANPFRVRAYRNAARTIADLSRPLAHMLAVGEDPATLPAIGREMAGHIREMLQTGDFALLRNLEREAPASLIELTHIEGVGPKRARMLHGLLGVASARELTQAIDEGRLEGVRGIGPRTIERIRRGLAALERRAGRFRLIDADRIVQPLLEQVRASPAVQRAEVAGSYRRRRETVGDIDLLVSSPEPSHVMRHLLRFPGIEHAADPESDGGVIVLRDGMRLDLCIVPDIDFGAALHDRTGSKAHTDAIRRLGRERGLRIDEHGAFRDGGARGPVRTGGAEEMEIFRAVDLPWIPPELREDRGEIEAAREGRLPRLIRLEDIRGDLQMHSTWSDGRHSLEAMAAACIDRGYAYMAITDHSPSAAIARGLSPEDIARQAGEIEEVRRRFPQLLVLRGLEVDILRDGSLDLPDSMLSELDLVLVSVHSAMRMDGRQMTERVIRAMTHPGVHILGHPTGRLIHRREPYEIDMEAVLVAAAEQGVAVELNAQPHRLDVNEVQARRAKEMGVTLVIDTDAHSTGELSYMACGVDQARRAWLEPQDVLNTRSAEDLLTWLRTRSRASTSAIATRVLPPDASRSRGP